MGRALGSERGPAVGRVRGIHLPEPVPDVESPGRRRALSRPACAARRRLAALAPAAAPPSLQSLIVREFHLLSKVYEHSAALDARVIVPPGDDMAMVRFDGADVLAAVDQIVQGRHFTLESTPLALIGRKAVTRNLSDIAAMAARPLASLAAVVLPRSWSEAQALELFEAMRTTAARYDCPLVGGDISIADAPLMCSVTVLARPGPRGPILRSGAKVGDAVYVSGSLGGSVEPGGRGRHLTFEPRLDLALALAERFDLHAMIDISDGLGRDAGHIAQMSRVQIVLDADRVPCSPACNWRRAMSDGEDYELCFTLAADARVPLELCGAAITRIGVVREQRGNQPCVIVREGGREIDATQLGWEHGGSGEGQPPPRPSPAEPGQGGRA